MQRLWRLRPRQWVYSKAVSVLQGLRPEMTDERILISFGAGIRHLLTLNSGLGYHTGEGKTADREPQRSGGLS